MKSTKLQKKVAKFALPAALVAGGLTAGSIFSPVGFASAQDSDTDPETPTTTEQPETEAPDIEASQKAKGLKRGNHQSGAVAEALGLTEEEVKAGFAEDKSLAEIAEENGVALSDLKTAIVDEMNEQIDSAVSDGRLDADKAAERKAAVDEAVDKIVETKPSDREGHRGKGHGKMGKRVGQRGEQFEPLAEVLGLSADEIREGLSSGKSMAELATEQGVSEDELVTGLLEGMQERVDEAIESGKVDADKAAETTANAEERIREFVNGERPERSDRTERTDRSDRTERTDRSDRTERTDRTERPEQADRPERNGERGRRGGSRDAGSEQLDTSSVESNDV